ncbi:MAG TPA: SPOR domain-containing protein [Xanthobacteraceae bacterium]|nr:SPOR domain-containing protein [Xanthobacteraceae bacterium]
MADQTRFRSQQRDPGSSQAPSQGARGRFSPRSEDPLAELARLIGQDDPFTDFRGDPRSARQPSGNGHAPKNGRGRDPYDDDEQDYDPRDAYTRRGTSRRQRYADDDDRYADDDAPRANGRGAYAYGGGQAEHEEEDDSYQPAPDPVRQRDAGRYPSPQASRRPASRTAEYADEPEDDYEDPRYARGNRGGNGYADPRQAYDDGGYDQDEPAGYEPGYEDRYPGEQDEQSDVDPGRGRKRWLFIGVAAGLGCLVIGASGVYGYRMLFGRHAGGTPPTIRPADTPIKVPPQETAQTGTDGGQKLIYDRLDGQQPSERIVSREEQPAIQPQAQNPVSPPALGPTRVVSPQPAGPVTAFAPVPGTPPNAPAVIAGSTPANALPSTEPRKVRTTTVRADGTIVDAPPRVAQPAQRQQPLALSPYSQQPDQSNDPNAQPATPTRTAAIAPVQTRAQPANQQPWAGTQQQPVTAPPTQQASNYVPAGSYVVQVASQKTEADARTSWQQLQAKYANVFGSYQASIKRVDLGDRGTFYRAMLGPFANRDQAYEMCQSLKAAGGECIVQRN